MGHVVATCPRCVSGTVSGRVTRVESQILDAFSIGELAACEGCGFKDWGVIADELLDARPTAIEPEE